MNLPNDVARCDGILVKPYVDFWEPECVECPRRLAQQADRRGTTVAYMKPPEFIDGKCPERVTEKT